MRRRSAAPDLHDDLQSCDRRTARELQLAADCMLGSGGDVSDPRRRGPDQAVVGHHEVDEHVYVERILLLRFVAEDDAVAHSRAAVGIGPRRPAGLDDRLHDLVGLLTGQPERLLDEHRLAGLQRAAHQPGVRRVPGHDEDRVE